MYDLLILTGGEYLLYELHIVQPDREPHGFGITVELPEDI